ncbi:MAG: N-acetylglutaminylglutamine synthetase [Planctomycetota bacterium]|nr:MAG: N-acetylglutaminylglutamine synthetase [Planctomycetota bacterium]
MSQSVSQGAAVVEVGWGRLIFAHTFTDPDGVAQVLLDEKPSKRDIAFYVIDPQLVLKVAPQDLFLDPSNTYRLDLKKWKPGAGKELPFRITPLERPEDLDQINQIYARVKMVPIDADLVWKNRDSEKFQYYVARPPDSDDIIGVVLAVDHVRCFDDLFNSCSLWALAVDPQTQYPGVGMALVRHVADTFARRGRALLDLSVLGENEAAASLYEHMGFVRSAVFAVKRRNQINEPLFTAQHAQEGYNPYAKILINEALRRGIAVESLDPARGYFRLSQGNRRVTCRESLTDLTSAIAMSRCADKQLTLELLAATGLRVPEQIVYADRESAVEFLQRHTRVVVKPAQGEQGQGVSVDLRTEEELWPAIEAARHFCDVVLLEQFVEGLDLRIIVIHHEVVAAAVRKPAEIIGTGRHTIRELIGRVSRRRQAATGGESQIPQDEETERCITSAGFSFDDVLPDGQELQVRRAANLHTGGTIHDVTDQLHPTLRDAAVEAAGVLEIPVVGLDFLVPSVEQDEYVIIEANERPGLANHEPQPTAERFIDLLFPHTAKPTS